MYHSETDCKYREPTQQIGASPSAKAAGLLLCRFSIYGATVVARVNAGFNMSAISLQLHEPLRNGPQHYQLSLMLYTSF